MSERMMTVQKKLQEGFYKWDQLSLELERLHEEQHEATKFKMDEAILLYKRLLFMFQVLIEEQDRMRYLPYNDEDRLAFIQKKKRSRAAFSQLVNLMEELRKKQVAFFTRIQSSEKMNNNE